MIQKISTGTIIAVLLALASSAGAAPFPRYAEFPPVSAILADRDSSIASPKATLVHHGVHVIDGANMEEFFQIFKSLAPEQRLKFLEDKKWPDAAWKQFNADWSRRLLKTSNFPNQSMTRVIKAVPPEAFRRIPLSEVNSILLQLSSSDEDYFEHRWFYAHFHPWSLHKMDAATYLSWQTAFIKCGQFCSSLKDILRKSWGLAIAETGDKLSALDVTNNLEHLSVTNRATLLTNWMASPNSKASIEKITPAELIALIQAVPNDYKGAILDIWMAAASQRTAMTPAEVKTLLTNVPEASKPAILETWMKAAAAKPQ